MLKAITFPVFCLFVGLCVFNARFGYEDSSCEMQLETGASLRRKCQVRVHAQEGGNHFIEVNCFLTDITSTQAASCEFESLKPQ